jgi:hypothetical protein
MAVMGGAAMPMRGIMLLALALEAGFVAGSPLSANADENELQLSLPQGPKSWMGSQISLGSVGMDSRAGTTRWKAMPEDPYRFWIPADRPARKVPGFMVRIPFGGGSAK